MPDRPGNGIAFEGCTPILSVLSLDRSLDFYVTSLGFAVEWQEPGFASVRRGRVGLFLCEGDQGHPGGWVWIVVGDSEALHADLLARGVPIRHAPTNYPWALEMQVEDPDGNVLRLGSEQKEGAPTGEWLDMRGVRWIPQRDGEWRRGSSTG